MKRSIIVVLLVVLFISNAFGIEIKDDAQRSLNITNVHSIVALAPAVCDILSRIGANSLIVGYTDYANKPNKKAQNVGAFGSYNLGKIISLKPDLVIMPYFTYKRYGVKPLNALGIKTYVFDPKNIEEILLDVKKFGAMTNKSKQANLVIERFNNELKSFHKFTYKPTFVFLVWLAPPIVAGTDTFVSNAIQMAGGKNVINKPGWVEVSSEYLIEKNPHFLIINSHLKNVFLKQNKLIDYFYLKHRVIFINNNLIERPSLDIIKGMKFLNEKFYENSHYYGSR